MKQQLRFIAVLSAIAVGTLGAQAQTEGAYPLDSTYPNVEAYPFLTWAPEKNGNSYTQTPATTSVTSSSGKEIYLETETFNGHSFNNRFGYLYALTTKKDKNGNTTTEWTKNPKLSATKGLSVSGKRGWISIQGLKAGDIVTITHDARNDGTDNNANTYVGSNNASYISSDGSTVKMTDYKEDSAYYLQSKVSYTLTSDGSFDFCSVNSKSFRITNLTIVRPTITLGSTGYGTYTNLTSNDFIVPDGLKAYTATSYADGSVTLTTTSVIHAGQGVVLKGAANTPYTFTQQAAAEATATNLMQPVTEDITLAASSSEGTNYILGVDGGKVGFYPTSGSGTLAAGKSYLQVPSSSPAKLNIVFDNNTATGISAVADGHKGRTLQSEYNLAGQRVGKGYHGIVIVNGKKIIRK